MSAVLLSWLTAELLLAVARIAPTRVHTHYIDNIEITDCTCRDPDWPRECRGHTRRLNAAPLPRARIYRR